MFVAQYSSAETSEEHACCKVRSSAMISVQPNLIAKAKSRLHARMAPSSIPVGSVRKSASRSATDSHLSPLEASHRAVSNWRSVECSSGASMPNSPWRWVKPLKFWC